MSLKEEKTEKARLLTINLPKDINTIFLNNKRAKAIALSCVEWFNKHDEALLTFIRTVRRQEDFSLRVIDWTITNYSKRNRITVYHEGLPIDLYNDYRRYLAVFTKRYFDPFARRERLILRINPEKETLSTTVGQLNFMRWLLEKNVHRKVQELKKVIEMDMREYDGKSASSTPSEHRFLVYNGPFRLIF
jgi:hypothetical protein